jgi:hypothetical protein
MSIQMAYDSTESTHSLGGIVVKSGSALSTASAAHRLTAAGTHPLRRGRSRRSRRVSLDQAVDIRRHVYRHAAPRRQRRCARQADSQHSVGFFSGTRSAAAPSRARLRMAAVARPYNNPLTLPPSERCAASPPLPRSEPQPLHATGKERGRRRAIAPKRSQVPALVAVLGKSTRLPLSSPSTLLSPERAHTCIEYASRPSAPAYIHSCLSLRV